MSPVKLFVAVSSIISVKIHLKGAFGFNVFLDLVFFMEDIYHDVQKGYVSKLSSISSQKLAVNPDINDLLDLFPNIWCNNSKATFFLCANFFVFDICFIFTKSSYFRCAICGKLTTFFSLSPKYTVQNTSWDKQVCPKFINVIM